jgi:hypothetical protein
MSNKTPRQIRLLEKCAVDPKTGCWEWMRAKINGYGVLSVKSRAIKAHRIAWELFRGPIPAGMLVCHTCDNRACINPAHLYVGTYTNNNHDIIERRGHHNSNKTHCKHGHEFNEENTRRSPRGRHCIACTRNYERGYKRARRSIANDTGPPKTHT